MDLNVTNADQITLTEITVTLRTTYSNDDILEYSAPFFDELITTDGQQEAYEEDIQSYEVEQLTQSYSITIEILPVEPAEEDAELVEEAAEEPAEDEVEEAVEQEINESDLIEDTFEDDVV